jgi:hypothetical protein
LLCIPEGWLDVGIASDALDTASVGLEGALDFWATDRPVGTGLFPLPQRRRGGGPRLAVAGETVGPELGAERDQRSEIGNRVDRPGLRDSHEPMRVQVVAEEERRVCVSRREQPRRPVVEQVALVDRLETECVPLLGERGEDRVVLTLETGPKRLRPERALVARLGRDRVPDAGRYSQPASSFVQYETTRSAPARTIAVSDSSAAWRSSSQPRALAALSIAYSPETL